jgi:hypothetical protein
MHKCMESLTKIAMLLEQACDNIAQHPNDLQGEGCGFLYFETSLHY